MGDASSGSGSDFSSGSGDSGSGSGNEDFDALSDAPPPYPPGWALLGPRPPPPPRLWVFSPGAPPAPPAAPPIQPPLSPPPAVPPDDAASVFGVLSTAAVVAGAAGVLLLLCVCVAMMTCRRRSQRHAVYDGAFGPGVEFSALGRGGSSPGNRCRLDYQGAPWYEAQRLRSQYSQNI